MGSIPSLKLRSCKPCIQKKKEKWWPLSPFQVRFYFKEYKWKKKKEHCVAYSYICPYCLCSVMSDSLKPCRLQPTRLLCLWDSPGKKSGVGRHFLLQGFLPIQGSNPHLLHQIVSCIAEGFTIWATMIDGIHSEKCQVESVIMKQIPGLPWWPAG